MNEIGSNTANCDSLSTENIENLDKFKKLKYISKYKITAKIRSNKNFIFLNENIIYTIASPVNGFLSGK